jgi:hypothetical protein
MQLINLLFHDDYEKVVSRQQFISEPRANAKRDLIQVVLDFVKTNEGADVVMNGNAFTWGDTSIYLSAEEWESQGFELVDRSISVNITDICNVVVDWNEDIAHSFYPEDWALRR